MKYLSLFSGIGGFELGIERAFNKQSTEIKQNGERWNGITNKMESDVLLTGRSTTLCIGFSELDKYATQIYKKHFQNHKELGDVTKINAETLEDFDLLVGGFPCQAFSIAGRRGGFDDTRGTLFFEIARIVREKQPRLLLLENVKGLLSHDKGATFATILSTLDELGYDVEWQVLNSKNFGVPQNRERVFIVGHSRRFSGRKIFPIGGTNETNCNVSIIGHRINYRRNTQVYGSDGITEALDTGQGGGRGQYTAIPVLTPDREEKRQNGRRFKENGEPSFTLTAQDKHGIYDGVKIRRLTPTECERLQGFPDGFTAEGVDGKISDSQRYKCLGNAVTVNVIEAIMMRILLT